MDITAIVRAAIATSATMIRPPASTMIAAPSWSCWANRRTTSPWASTARARATRASAWVRHRRGPGLPVDTPNARARTFLANRLAHRLESRPRAGASHRPLYPDGKVQVSLRYRDDEPAALTDVVVSAHHHAGAELARLRRDVKRLVVKPVLEPHGPA